MNHPPQRAYFGRFIGKNRVPFGTHSATFLSLEASTHFPLPSDDKPNSLPHGQEVNSNRRADDFLHVGSNDGEFDHQPQDNPRNLEVQKDPKPLRRGKIIPSPFHFLDGHGVVAIKRSGMLSLPCLATAVGVENTLAIAILWLVQSRNPGYLWQSLEEVPRSLI